MLDGRKKAMAKMDMHYLHITNHMFNSGLPTLGIHEFCVTGSIPEGAR